MSKQNKDTTAKTQSLEPMADKEVWGRGEVFAAMRAKFSLEYPPLISQEYSQEHPAEYRQNDSPEYSQLYEQEY